MNPKVALTVATLSAVVGAGQAIFFTGATLGTAAVATTTLGVTTGGAALGAIALGGLALLKGAAIAALVTRGRGGRGHGRHRREAEDVVTDSDAFALIATVEPAACYRRLICDLATGELPTSDNEVILSLFGEEVAQDSPKFEFATAAKVGAVAKDIKTCELRYSCPLEGKQINALLAA